MRPLEAARIATTVVAVLVLCMVLGIALIAGVVWCTDAVSDAMNLSEGLVFLTIVAATAILECGLDYSEIVARARDTLALANGELEKGQL